MHMSLKCHKSGKQLKHNITIPFAHTKTQPMTGIKNKVGFEKLTSE
jgi:hypothetical protein